MVIQVIRVTLALMKRGRERGKRRIRRGRGSHKKREKEETDTLSALEFKDICYTGTLK